MAKEFKQRWRGHTERQVSEKMKEVAARRFKSKGAALKHATLMVAKRKKHWVVVNGKRTYVDRVTE